MLVGGGGDPSPPDTASDPLPRFRQHYPSRISFDRGLQRLGWLSSAITAGAQHFHAQLLSLWWAGSCLRPGSSSSMQDRRWAPPPRKTHTSPTAARACSRTCRTHSRRRLRVCEKGRGREEFEGELVRGKNVGESGRERKGERKRWGEWTRERKRERETGGGRERETEREGKREQERERRGGGIRSRTCEVCSPRSILPPVQLCLPKREHTDLHYTPQPTHARHREHCPASVQLRSRFCSPSFQLLPSSCPASSQLPHSPEPAHARHAESFAASPPAASKQVWHDQPEDAPARHERHALALEASPVIVRT
jgi:hypothetical protein